MHPFDIARGDAALYPPGIAPETGDSPDAGMFRSVVEHESLDLTGLYTVQDLLRESTAAETNAADLKLLLYALLFAISEGGLCLRVNDVPALSAVLSRMAPGFDRAPQRAAELVAYASGPAFENLNLVAMSRKDGAEFRPLIYEREAGFLYFQKHFAYKHSVARQVAAFFAKPVDVTAFAPGESPGRRRLASALRDVLETRPVRGASGRPLRMAAAQQLAILLGMIGAGVDRKRSGNSRNAGNAGESGARGGFLIVTGGPGTGKTSTVLGLLRGLMRQGLDPAKIGIAAPTGRAARRLTESLQNGLESIAEPAPEDLALERLRGVTLHQLLRFQPRRNRFAHDAANPLVLDALVVDEVSMVDAALMAHLLEAVDVARTRVVFLGDRDQLPSVDAGAVLADFLRLLAPEDQPPLYSREVLSIARETLPDFSAAAVDAFQVMERAGADPNGASRGRLTDHIVQLTESFRSGDAILKVAATVNSGRAAEILDPAVLPELPATAARGEADVPGDRSWPEAGCYRIAASEREAAAVREAVVLDWVREHFDGDYIRLVRAAAQAPERSGDERPEGARGRPRTESLRNLLSDIFAHINGSRILAIHRRGRSGVAGLNRVAARWLESRLNGDSRAGRSSVGGGRGASGYFPGLPILITRNDHRRELYNGDVGVVLKVSTRSGPALRACFERPGGRFASFPIAVLPEFEAAFALTVHKSQGSEYRRVLILLPDDTGHRLLSREVLYTGLTRAKDLAILFGPTAALEAAVGRKLLRETGSLYEFERD